MALSGREGRLARPPPAVSIRHQDATNLRCNKNYNLIRRKATPRNIVYAQQFSRNFEVECQFTPQSLHEHPPLAAG